MTLRLGMVTFDTLDALTLARWWADACNGEITQENDGWFVVVAVPEGPLLAFQKVEDPTPGKNRVHLDLTTTDDLDETAGRLLAAGATQIRDETMGDFRWMTLADPDGNHFCVAPAHEAAATF